MTKLIFAFRNFSNAPKNKILQPIPGLEFELMIYHIQVHSIMSTKFGA